MTPQPDPQAQPGAPLPADPLLDDVRHVRRALSEQFGNDVNRLGEHLREIQKQHPGKVRRAPEPNIRAAS